MQGPFGSPIRHVTQPTCRPVLDIGQPDAKGTKEAAAVENIWDGADADSHIRN